VFEQYRAILQERHPEIRVYGEHFPPHPLRMYGANFLGVAKILLIMLVLTSTNPFRVLNLETPGFWEWCIGNKFYSCLVIFFFSNMFESQLISTGAFEISFNDVPVWSKLETGRVPNPPELLQIIDNHIRFQSQTPTVLT